MPTYEFACPKCLKKGRLSEWEMEFGMNETKKSFCPKCGAVGTQVIRTTPMVVTNLKRFNEADRLTRNELERRGLTDWQMPQQVSYDERVAQAEEAFKNTPPSVEVPSRLHPQEITGADPFRPRAVQVDGEVVAEAQAATAATRQVNGESNFVSKLPKTIPTDAIAMKGDPHVRPSRGNFNLHNGEKQ